MADNLESFFKKHLSDESSGEDNWNIPSDNVWEKALPEIQKKSGVFIPWKYLIIIGIFAVVGIALVLFKWNYKDIETLDATEIAGLEIENSDQSQNTIQSSDSLTKINDYQNAIAIKNEIGKEAPDKIVKEDLLDNESKKRTTRTDSKNNELLNVTEKNTTKTKNENQNKLVEDKTLTLPAGKKIEKGSSEKQPSNNAIAVPESEKIETEVISSTPVLVTNDSINKQIPQNKLSENSEDIKPSITKKQVYSNKGKIGIGVYFSPTLTSTYLRGDMISGIENTSPVFLYSGNYGLEIKYHFSNRLAIVSGVGRSEIKSWSRSLVDFAYDSKTEHIMDDGKKENTSPIPMPTPFGEIDTHITYQFPGSEEIPNGDMMQSKLETHQSIMYLSIPLGVEYNIINFSRLNWFAEGGVCYNSSILDGSEFSSKIIHKGDDMNVMHEEIIGHPTYKDYYFNYFVGTGINYRLSKLFQVGASAIYKGNLTKVNLQDNMTTNVHGLNLKIGIVYIF